MAGPHFQGADALGLNEVGQGISILESRGYRGREEGRKREMKEDRVAMRTSSDLSHMVE